MSSKSENERLAIVIDLIELPDISSCGVSILKWHVEIHKNQVVSYHWILRFDLF